MTARALVVQGDALRLPLPDASVDAICTDPPYGLEFMGQEWDRFSTDPVSRSWNTKGRTKTNAPERDPTTPGGRSGAITHLRDNPRCRKCSRTIQGADTAKGFKVCHCDQPDIYAPSTTARNYQRWCERWAAEALRVLKPGGHLLAFGGTRTYHRLASGIEDAGFELRDSCLDCNSDPAPDHDPMLGVPGLAWIHGQGFPKNLDVSKAIDKAAGAEREVVGPNRYASRASEDPGLFRQAVKIDQTAPATPEAARWQGWGTAMKPAFEPIVVARKPLAGTVAQNVLTWGTGALNIAATRISHDDDLSRYDRSPTSGMGYGGVDAPTLTPAHPAGRWPPNVVLSHTPDCQPTGTRKVKAAGWRPDDAGLGREGWGTMNQQRSPGYADPDGTETVQAWTCRPDCPVALLDTQSGRLASHGIMRADTPRNSEGGYHGGFPKDRVGARDTYGDQGGASRFFYCAKPDQAERVTVNGISHPTQKPLDLMRWLVRLVTPPDGIVLDCFAGSGTTGEAAMLEGRRSILVEREAAYLPHIRVRTNPFVRRSKVVTNGQLVGPEQMGLL